jgi:hypothetical protein
LGDGVAHPGVGEDRPPGVEHEALHARRRFDRDLFHDQPAGCHSPPVIGGRPALGDVLDPEIHQPAIERLESDPWIEIVIMPDRSEIEPADIDRQILAPIIGNPFVGDRSSWLQARDPVRAAP